MLNQDLLTSLLEFRNKRNWEQFHKPKDLAISLSVEAGELLELFQWKTDEEVSGLIHSDYKERIEDEVADLAILLSYLCHDLGLDLNSAVRSKLEKNEAKYPVHKAYGASKPTHSERFHRRHRVLVHRYGLQRRKLFRATRLLHRRGRTLRETQARAPRRDRRSGLGQPQQHH